MATTALAVVPEPEDDRLLSTLSLQELGVIANSEHRATVDSGRSMVGHALAAGAALQAARDYCRVEKIPWGEWLEANFVGNRSTVKSYLRLNHYRDRLSGETPSVAEALRSLRGLPAANPKGRYGNLMEDDPAFEAAQELRSEGKSYSEIATQLGISISRVQRYVNPKRARERNRKAWRKWSQAKAALAAQEREKEIRAAVKSSGKGVSKFYASLERMQDELAEARAEVDDLGDTQALFHRLRDEFVSKALGVS